MFCLTVRFDSDRMVWLLFRNSVWARDSDACVASASSDQRIQRNRQWGDRFFQSIHWLANSAARKLSGTYCPVWRETVRLSTIAIIIAGYRFVVCVAHWWCRNYAKFRRLIFDFFLSHQLKKHATVGSCCQRLTQNFVWCNIFATYIYLLHIFTWMRVGP